MKKLVSLFVLVSILTACAKQQAQGGRAETKAPVVATTSQANLEVKTQVKAKPAKPALAKVGLEKPPTNQLAANTSVAVPTVITTTETPNVEEQINVDINPTAPATVTTAGAPVTTTSPELEPQMPEARTSTSAFLTENAPQVVAEPTTVATNTITEPVPANEELVPTSTQTFPAQTTVTTPASEPVATKTTEVDSVPTAIAGKMTIEFLSRSLNADESSKHPEKAVDTYSLDLNVPNSLRVKGNIVRKPRLVSQVLGREQRALELNYTLALSGVTAETRGMARMLGSIFVDRDNQYSFNNEHNAGLRLSTYAKGQVERSSNFSGTILGKKEAARTLKNKITEYTRILRGKTIKLQTRKTDPLAFSNLQLAAGPLEIYPTAIVNGNLDFDYDTGNWLTNGIEFRYHFQGKTIRDIVTGSIKWIEDPNRLVNGKGYYEFNLRLNEANYDNRNDESGFFSELPNEEAFFSVDPNIPHLGGTISYQDTFLNTPGTEEEPRVINSEVTYNLKAQKLTNQQVINFLKLWLLIVGPVNDE
ncbi:hypothetical protein JNK13_07945 [bacterium]|nr:hypothetical protein [bacterium]